MVDLADASNQYFDWPEMEPVDAYPDWLFQRIDTKDVAVLAKKLVFGDNEPQYLGENAKQNLAKVHPYPEGSSPRNQTAVLKTL
jgi:hypothetical protein